MTLRDGDRAATVDLARMVFALLGALSVVAPLLSLSVTIAVRPDSRRRLALATVAAILGWQVVIAALVVTNSAVGWLAFVVPAALAVRDAEKSPRDEWKLLAGIYLSPAVLFATLAALSSAF